MVANPEADQQADRNELGFVMLYYDVLLKNRQD